MVTEERKDNERRNERMKDGEGTMVTEGRSDGEGRKDIRKEGRTVKEGR